MPDKAQKIVRHMMDNDAYSQWLGIDILHVETGEVEIRMQVRKEMTNGFGIAHGGITYGLADSALAFSCNGHGQQAVSIETSISHTRPVFVGDVLTARSRQMSRTRKIGVYEVSVVNQDNKTVGLFKGTVFIKEEEWPEM